MNMLSFNFWKTAFIGAAVTMVCMFVIKKVTAKVDIPVVSDIAQSV